MARTLLYLLVALPLASQWQWPLVDVEVLQNFTENTMTLQSDQREVVSIADGVLVYIALEHAFAPLPTPLGGYVLVSHDDGYYSFYARFSPQSADEEGGLAGAARLGRLVDSGYTYQPALVFGVLDGALRNWVNPRLVLPELAEEVPDLKRLRVVEREDGAAVVALLQENLIDAPDLAPYRVSFTLNGQSYQRSYALSPFKSGMSRAVDHSQLPLIDSALPLEEYAAGVGELLLMLWNYAGERMDVTLPLSSATR